MNGEDDVDKFDNICFTKSMWLSKSSQKGHNCYQSRDYCRT